MKIKRRSPTFKATLTHTCYVLSSLRISGLSRFLTLIRILVTSYLAIDFVVCFFFILFGLPFCNGTKDQRKLIQTNFIVWTDQKRDISLIESHGNYFNCQIVRLLGNLCYFSSFHLFLLCFFLPLSKKFQFANLIWTKNWRRHGTFKCVRAEIVCVRAHVSSFHDFFLFIFDFSMSRRMQRINSQNDMTYNKQKYRSMGNLTVFTTSRLWCGDRERADGKEKNE